MSYPQPPGLKQGQKIDDWLKSVHSWLEECHRIMADAPVNAELEKVKAERDEARFNADAFLEGSAEWEDEAKTAKRERDQALADCKAMAEALAFYAHEKHEVEVDIFVDADDSRDEAGFYRMIDNGDKAREALTTERREKYLNQTPMPCHRND